MPLDSASDVSVRSPTSRPAPSNLVQRLLSAAVLFPLVVVTVWLGGWLMVGVAAGCAVLALYELYQIFARTGYRPRRIGYACAVLFVVAAGVRGRFAADLTGLVLLLSIIAPLIGEFPRRERDGSLQAWALTLCGAVYVGWTMAHFVLLRHVDHPLRPAPLQFLRLEAGAAWIIGGMLITIANDTAAYFVGSRWGSRRMAPYISPKKSWEGALGGALASIIVGICLVPVLGLPVSIGIGAGLGLACAIAGQTGDLAESLIKRQVGVKDSGHLIPGHGGILDRADSLLFTVPILYYLVRWLTA